MFKGEVKYLNALYKKPIAYSLFLGVLILFISCTAIFSAVKIYQHQEQENMLAQLELVKSTINRMLKTVDLEAFNLAMEIADDGAIDNLDSIGTVILGRNPFVIGVQIVPQGVIRDVYPYERHKDAIGLDILNLPSAKKAALKAIENKKLFYAGPLTLKQGGLAILARLPIFKDGKFWGFSVIMIDFESFLQEIEIYQKVDNNIHLQFAYLNENTGEVEIWNEYKNNYSKKLNYRFTDTNWEVSVISEVAYYVYVVFFLFIFAGILIAVLAAYLLYTILKKPKQLEKLLQNKSKELLVQNAYFSSLINAMPDFIFIIDKDGTLLNFHSATTDGLIDSPKNFIGRKLSTYFDEDLSQRLIGKINFAIREGELTSHTYSLIVKGKKEYFEARIVKINKNEALVFVRKVSETINSNFKLIQSEAKYRHLVQKAPDFIFQTNAEGILLSANNVGLRLTEFSENELKKMHINDVIQLNDAKESSFERLKLGGKDAVSATLVNKKGQHVQVEVTASVINNRGLLAIARDVTERNKYIEFIESQNEKLSEITWIQSHQVRAPLAKIMSLVSFIKSNYDNTDFNKEQVIKGMEDSLGELDQIIREIVHKSEISVKEVWKEEQGNS